MFLSDGNEIEETTSGGFSIRKKQKKYLIDLAMISCIIQSKFEEKNSIIKITRISSFFLMKKIWLHRLIDQCILRYVIIHYYYSIKFLSQIEKKRWRINDVWLRDSRTVVIFFFWWCYKIILVIVSASDMHSILFFLFITRA